MIKKRVLCFGDSNTWGYNGENSQRYDENTRWTGRLQNSLGSDFAVIEEGQNGRTFVNDDPYEGSKSGIKYLVPCLETSDPLDYFIIMLGTNDLKMRFNLPADDIALGLFNVLQKAFSFWKYKNKKIPKVLVMSPAHISEDVKNAFFASAFIDNGILDCIRRSKELANKYKVQAEYFNCDFLDIAPFTNTCSADGIHLDVKSHEALANAVKNWIMEEEK